MMSANPDKELFSKIIEIPEFSTLSEKTFEKVKNRLEIVKFDPGELLIQSGNPFQYLYLITKGEVDIRITSKQESFVVATIPAPAVVGVISAVFDVDSIADVIAKGPCETVRFGEDVLHEILQSHPTIVDHFKRITYEYMKENLLSEYLTELFGTLDFKSHHFQNLETIWDKVRRGEILFHQGDPSDHLYIVINGRLRASQFDSQGNEKVLGDIGVGETVGEVGVFANKPRMATVYALRESILVKVPAKLFRELKAEVPQVSENILNLILNRLTSESSSKKKAPPKTIAVIGGNQSEYHQNCVQELVAQLSNYGKSLYIDQNIIKAQFNVANVEKFIVDPISKIRLYKALNEYETSHDFLLFELGDNSSAWTRLILKNIDAIIVIKEAQNSTELKGLEKLIFTSSLYTKIYKRLVLLRPEGEKRIKNTQKWLEHRDVLSHHHVRREKRVEDIARVARFIANEAVGLVLGGGGARGGAHIGVIKALWDLNIEYDYVGGTSIGAIAGVLAGVSNSNAEIDKNTLLVSDYFKLDYTLPISSLVSGKKLRELMDILCDDLFIEDLPIPFFAVSSNMSQAIPIIHKRGKLSKAVLCSICLPGIFPPQVIDGDVVADGGIIDNVPVDHMREELRGGKIICSDVTPIIDMKDNYLPEAPISGWRLLWDKIFRRKVYHVPSIVAILLRAGQLSSTYEYNKKNVEKEVELLFKAPVDYFSLLDMSKMKDIIEVGYRYAKELLADKAKKGEYPFDSEN